MNDSHFELKLKGGLDPEQVNQMRATVEAWLEERGMAVQVRGAVMAVLEELVTNIMEHSNAQWMDISMAGFKEGVLLSVQDNGEPFDPVEVIRSRDYETKLSAGTDRNLGLFMVKELAKKFKYYREQSAINRVVMEIPLRAPKMA